MYFLHSSICKPISAYFPLAGQIMWRTQSLGLFFRTNRFAAILPGCDVVTRRTHRITVICPGAGHIVTAMKVEGRRKRGRPKRRWLDKVKDDIKENLSADEVYDRATWRRMSSYMTTPHKSGIRWRRRRNWDIPGNDPDRYTGVIAGITSAASLRWSATWAASRSPLGDVTCVYVW